MPVILCRSLCNERLVTLRTDKPVNGCIVAPLLTNGAPFHVKHLTLGWCAALSDDGAAREAREMRVARVRSRGDTRCFT